MPRTAVGSFGDDWRKWLGAALAVGAIVGVARKSEPDLGDLLRLGGAAVTLYFFFKD